MNTRQIHFLHLPLGFRASNRDITVRKQAEEGLRQSCVEIEQLKNQLEEAESAYLQDEIQQSCPYHRQSGFSSG